PRHLALAGRRFPRHCGHRIFPRAGDPHGMEGTPDPRRDRAHLIFQLALGSPPLRPGTFQLVALQIAGTLKTLSVIAECDFGVRSEFAVCAQLDSCPKSSRGNRVCLTADET